MCSTISNMVNSLDRWTRPVTRGMPAIATLVGVVLLSESIKRKSNDSRRVVGILGTTIGAITLFSPKVGRLASAVSLIPAAILLGITKP